MMRTIPLFAILSLLLPAAGLSYSWRIFTRSSADTMGGAIGIGIAAYLVFLTGCAAGEVAAIIALFRGEKPGWLPAMGALLNLSAAVFSAWFVLNKK